MKFKDGMLVAAAIALLASCNNAGTDKETKDTAVTTYDNTTRTDYTTIEVPATTRTSFETKYPKASNVTWYRYDPDLRPIEWDWSGWPMLDTSDYTAKFNWDGRDYWVWYDDQGEWVGTVTNITDFSTLPAAVTATINSSYSGYTIASASMENDKNRNAYEIHLEKGSDKMKVLVDENGKIMKKKAVTGGVETKEKPIKDSM
jgi:hypothetical protein